MYSCEIVDMALFETGFARIDTPPLRNFERRCNARRIAGHVQVGDLKGIGPMDVKDLIVRASREIEWTPETSSAVTGLIQEVQLVRPHPAKWSTRRKLLISLPGAVVVAVALTAGGVSLANSLLSAPDAIVQINYTATDGSPVSCEVAVTATSGPAKQFIKDHDWSDVSRKVEQATLGRPSSGATPGAAGSAPRSAIEIIDSEIPETFLGGNVLLNFVTTCG